MSMNHSDFRAFDVCVGVGMVNGEKRCHRQKRFQGAVEIRDVPDS